jgi:hypothetical protein
MQFRLTYEGPLYGSSRTNHGRADHKHEIRKVFHKQLKRLWEITPMLANRVGHIEGVQKPQSEVLATHFTRNGYRFVPLVVEPLALLCRLDILFLRPDPPGSLVKSGDIDNRLKTLFDALRMPEHLGELGGHTVPGEGEDPFYCLLQDDKLITYISVETDLLLEPIGAEPSIMDARLIINVTVRPASIIIANLDFV